MKRGRRLLGALALALCCVLVGDAASWAASPGFFLRYQTALAGAKVTAYVETPALTVVHRFQIRCDDGSAQTYHQAEYLPAGTPAGVRVLSGTCPPGSGIAGYWFLMDNPTGSVQLHMGDAVTPDGYSPPSPSAAPTPAASSASCGSVELPCTVHLASVDEETYGGVGLYLGAGVFLLAALLASQLRRSR
jgi:hypothetical protein